MKALALLVALLVVTAGCGGSSHDNAQSRARRSPTTPRRRSTTPTAASSTTATRSSSTTSRSRAPASGVDGDAGRAAREGAVPGRRLPARHGRRPHRAPRPGDVDGGAWRRRDDDHDARAAPHRRRDGRREKLVAQRKAAVATVVAARRAVDVLQSLPQVDDDRIALVGWSSGARVGAIVAGRRPPGRRPSISSRQARRPSRSTPRRLPRSSGPRSSSELGAVDPLRWVELARPGTILLQDGTERRGRARERAGRARGSRRQGRRGALVRPGPRAVERRVGGSARLDGRPARRRRPDREGRCEPGLREAASSSSSVGVSCQLPAATLARTCSGFVAPAITDAMPVDRGEPADRELEQRVPTCRVANASSSSTRASRSSLSRPSFSPLSRAPSGSGSPRRYLPVRRPLSSGK